MDRIQSKRFVSFAQNALLKFCEVAFKEKLVTSCRATLHKCLFKISTYFTTNSRGCPIVPYFSIIIILQLCTPNAALYSCYQRFWKVSMIIWNYRIILKVLFTKFENFIRASSFKSCMIIQHDLKSNDSEIMTSWSKRMAIKLNNRERQWSTKL